MTEFRYKAFISYSHTDEAWAKWLHRALESYRIPRQLSGRRGSHGEIPKRVSPVFRDRDDLSSAHSLSDRIIEALKQSEALIVVCSPAAAESTWVNDEIRQFQSMGRGDRIYCVIVEGDPDNPTSLHGCFPPALFSGTGESRAEPLAADARKWADGKQLARLKLIAGLLGIQLDQLRRRDLQRRRKVNAIAGLGIIAALTLAVMAVISQVSSRHEREKAEQLATFIVEMGETLQSDTDLETLALISAESSKHFKNLDPDKLSPETGKKLALALRQMARISDLQGRSDEALKTYRESRDVLSGLSERYPEIPDLLFELGNAEYFIANLNSQQGHYDEAQQAFQNYHLIARRLLNSDPENTDWIMELSYSHLNLAALQLESGKGVDGKTLAHMERVIELEEGAMAAEPANETIISNYANNLGWVADAQMLACNLQSAMALREKQVELAKAMTRSDPGNNDLRRRYAFAVFGVAKVQFRLGRLVRAEQNLEHSRSILQQLSDADPTDMRYLTEILYKRSSLAALKAENGQMDEALAMLRDIEPFFRPIGETAQAGSLQSTLYIDFLLSYSDIEFRLNNPDKAGQYLEMAIQILLNGFRQSPLDKSIRERLLRAKYQWWETHGNTGLGRFPVITDAGQETPDAYQSCTRADLAARMYIIEGKPGLAAKETTYLTERSYAEPRFLRFCNEHGLCNTQP